MPFKEGLDINYFLLTEMVRLGLKYIGENETADIIHKIERGFESPDQIIHPAFIGFTQEVTEKIMTKELAINFSSSETSFFTDTNGELSRHVSEGNHAIDTLDGRMRTGGLTLEQARNTVGVEKARAINTSQMIQDIGFDDYFRITGKFQPEDGQEKLSPEQNAEKVSEKSELIQAGLIEKQSEIYSRSVSALEKKTQESQERLGELGMSAEEFFALQDMKRREEMKKLQEEVSARETKNNKHNGELQRRFGGMGKLR